MVSKELGGSAGQVFVSDASSMNSSAEAFTNDRITARSNLDPYRVSKSKQVKP